MKKKTLALILTFLFILALPFSAMANTQSKVLFLDNMQTLQDNQIQPSLDRPLSGEINASVAGQPLDKMGLKNAKANIKYDMDLAKNKAFFQLAVKVEGSEPINMNLNFYIVDDMLIIPTECLKTMSQFDPDMKMPADNVKYVYSKMEGFSFAELQMILNQSNQQEVAMELVKTLFEAVPDSCFSANGTTAKMDLDKLTIINYAKNFQNDKFVSKLAEQLAALGPADADKTQMAKDLKVPGDVSFTELFKNLNIRKCSTEVGPNTSEIDWDFGYSDEEMTMDCKVTSKSNIQKNNVSSVVNMDLGLKSPVDKGNLALKLYAESKANTEKSSGNMKIEVTGDMDGDELDLVADLDIKQEYKKAVSFVAPVLSKDNSIDAEALEPNDTDIENQISINVNDYEQFIMFDNAPSIEEGHIMVPARELAESLDGKVAWTPPATLVMSIADQNISMNIGNINCTVNNQSKEMAVAPVLKDGVTYVPLRFVAEELGYRVSFDKDSMEVSLTSKSAQNETGDHAL